MIALIAKIQETISHWWSEFTLQTRLMAGVTLVVSLLMSGLTFWAVNTIQMDAQMNDTRFGRDLGILLANNTAPLIAEGDVDGLSRFAGRFYRSTTSVRYIMYADPEGSIFFGIPYSEAQVKNALTIQRRIQLPEEYKQYTELPLVRQHRTPRGVVTDVFVPLNNEGKYLGVLAIGINPNPIFVTSSNLTRDVTIAVFIAIWAMVILGAVFNAFTITKPITELLMGVKSIAMGDFKQRINLPFGGELGELIKRFNEMAEKLQRYAEQNIEEMTAEKAKLETLVSTIADGAILLDNDLKVILANPNAKRIFNWVNREITGCHFLESLPSEVTPKLSPLLQEFTEGKSVEEVESIGSHELSEAKFLSTEVKLAVSGTTYKTIRVVLSQVLDQNQTVKGIAMTVQDITREAELNEAKSQFISNVSHELRTPLFNIKSFIETLYEYGEDLSHQERKEFLMTANSETDRLTRLVNDVLDLSRLESSKVYHLDAVDVHLPVEQVLRTYQLNAKDKEIELYQEIESNLRPVLGHYDLLLQVLNNLVGNSLKFTESGGKVVIRVYEIKGKVRLEISDTGIGIDAEDQTAIFDRFYRVENRVHTLEGTGLGLSIVRNIIMEKHNSQVHLVSEVGVGTTFWFDLEFYPSETVDLNHFSEAISNPPLVMSYAD